MGTWGPSNGKGSILFLTNLRSMEGVIVGLKCTGTNLKAKIHQTECWTVMSVYMQSILFVCFILTGTTSVSSVLYLHIPGLVSHPGCIPCLTHIARRVNSRSTVIMSRIKCLWNTNTYLAVPLLYILSTPSSIYYIYNDFFFTVFLLTVIFFCSIFCISICMQYCCFVPCTMFHNSIQSLCTISAWQHSNFILHFYTFPEFNSQPFSNSINRPWYHKC